MPLRLRKKIAGIDGSAKYRFSSNDAAQFESVFFIMKRRSPNDLIDVELPTICLSSQAGCGMRCDFCATAQLGLQRNLSAEELLAQYDYVSSDVLDEGKEIRIVGLMGMGEPLLNLTAVTDFGKVLWARNTDIEQLGISTVGVVPKMYALSEQEGIKYSLFVSLQVVSRGSVRNSVSIL